MSSAWTMHYNRRTGESSGLDISSAHTCLSDDAWLYPRLEFASIFLGIRSTLRRGQLCHFRRHPDSSSHSIGPNRESWGGMSLFLSLLVRHSQYCRCLTRQTTRLVAMFTMFLVATDFQKPTITINRSWAIVQRYLYHRTSVTIGWYVSGRDDMVLVLWRPSFFSHLCIMSILKMAHTHRWVSVFQIMIWTLFNRLVESVMNIYYLIRPGPNNDRIYPFPTGLRVSRSHWAKCVLICRY